MRILYFSRDYGSPTTTFIRNEVEHFALLHETLYLCQRYLGRGPMPGFVMQLTFRRNSAGRWLDWMRFRLGMACSFKDRTYSRQLTRVVEEFHPDLIHCHFGLEALMLLDNIEYRKYPVIIHFHGYDASSMLKNPAYVTRLREVFSESRVSVITCSRYLAARLADATAIDINRIFVLNYGIDSDMFRRKNGKAESDRKLFLQVSSFTGKKGHAYTLRAFRLLQEDGDRFRLVLAGDGPLKKKMIRLAHKLGLHAATDFPGVVGPEEVVRLMEEADVFVHHSITTAEGDMEGMPNSIMEAMAMELPVVSTVHSGIPELVTDGVDGFLVEEGDIAAFALKMREALKMGPNKTGRAKVKELYGKDRHNMELEKIYRKVTDADCTGLDLK